MTEPTSDRTTVKRKPQRAAYDRATVEKKREEKEKKRGRSSF